MKKRFRLFILTIKYAYHWRRLFAYPISMWMCKGELLRAVGLLLAYILLPIVVVVGMLHAMLYPFWVVLFLRKTTEELDAIEYKINTNKL